MKASVKIEWLLPFHDRGELTALNYEKAFIPPLPRRTAINRLNRLRELGWIQRVGETRATAYFLSPSGNARLAVVAGIPETAAILTGGSDRFSDSPVSLEAYLSNATFHLPESIRDELNELGKNGAYDSPLSLRWKADFCWNSLRIEGFFTARSEVETWLKTEANSCDKVYLDEGITVCVGLLIKFLFDWVNRDDLGDESIISLRAAFLENLSFLGEVPSGEKMKLILNKANAIEDSVEQSFFLLLYFMVLLPSSTSHGWIARMMTNIPLFRSGMVPQSFVGVEEEEYRNAVAALRVKGDLLPLRDLFVQTYRHSVRRSTRVMRTL